MSSTSIAGDVATALDPNAGILARIEAIEDFALRMTTLIGGLFPSASMPDGLKVPEAPGPTPPAAGGA